MTHGSASRDAAAWTRNDGPSPLRQSVKWLHLESIESFVRRLLAANGLETRDARLAVAPGLQEHRFRWEDHARFVEGLADHSPGHYERLVHVAQPDPAARYPERFLCRLCAAGDRVAQIPHDRENWCLRHPDRMVWVGPGTTPETQPVVTFDRSTARAERDFRRLVAAGRVSATLHARAWEMVRDNAWLTRPDGWKPPLSECLNDHEVRGRAALYSETVAVLELLSDPPRVHHWSTESPERLRETIATSLLPLCGPVDVLVERLVLWLRPLRREVRPTRIDPLDVPLDIVDVDRVIDVTAPYPRWIQRHPQAISEWDWYRNHCVGDPWAGEGISKAAWWVCDEGHSWETSAMVRGGAHSRCPYCVSQRVWPGQTDLATLHPELAEEWDRTPGVNVGDPSRVSANSNRVVGWKCSRGHRWRTAIANRSRLGSGCPVCANRRVLVGFNDLATTHPQLAQEWHPDNPKTPSEVTAGSSYRATWVCNDAHLWQSAVGNRTAHDTGCPFCSYVAIGVGYNDLATVNPELASEWDLTPGANDRAPSDVSARSRYRASWMCRRGHTWRVAVCRRMAGSGCRQCLRPDSNVTCASLSEDAWTAIASLVPSVKRTGVLDRRAVVEAAAWRFRTGARWRDIPPRFGKWSTIYHCFNRWAKQGVWVQVLERAQTLSNEIGDLDWLRSFETTVSGLHQDAIDSAARRPEM